MAVIVLTQAVRRIAVQYAKQVGGTTQLDAQRQFIPLKVNAVDVRTSHCGFGMAEPERYGQLHRGEVFGLHVVAVQPDFRVAHHRLHLLLHGHQCQSQPDCR